MSNDKHLANMKKTIIALQRTYTPPTTRPIGLYPGVLAGSPNSDSENIGKNDDEIIDDEDDMDTRRFAWEPL